MIGVQEVVDSPTVPGLAQSQQGGRPEPILRHDDKVHKEPRRGLDHPDLTVGHRDQPLIDQLVREGVARLTLHDVRLRLLVGHGDGGHHV